MPHQPMLLFTQKSKSLVFEKPIFNTILYLKWIIICILCLIYIDRKAYFKVKFIFFPQGMALSLGDKINLSQKKTNL